MIWSERKNPRGQRERERRQEDKREIKGLKRFVYFFFKPDSDTAVNSGESRSKIENNVLQRVTRERTADSGLSRINREAAVMIYFIYLFISFLLFKCFHPQPQNLVSNFCLSLFSNVLNLSSFKKPHPQQDIR